MNGICPLPSCHENVEASTNQKYIETCIEILLSEAVVILDFLVHAGDSS